MSTIILDAPPPIETQAGKVDHFSRSAERERQVTLQPQEETLPLGPLKVVHAFWLAGMSCDGCSSAAVGAGGFRYAMFWHLAHEPATPKLK